MILSELSTFRKINWKYVSSVIGLETLQKNVNACDIIALVGWCNPDHATDVWRGILKHILPNGPGKKLLFFDLADPTKKSVDDLLEVLDVINGHTPHGPVILGLNENETIKLYDIVGRNGTDDTTDLVNIGKSIFSKLSIDGLLIHPTDRSILVQRSGVITLEGHVVKEPKISTGGGDNMNAGFCTGFLAGFTPEESMILGMATSGAYVRNGKSPTLDEVIEYLDIW
jgi:fructose-1-phosphate kinase PfkB-like protein